MDSWETAVPLAPPFRPHWTLSQSWVLLKGLPPEAVGLWAGACQPGAGWGASRGDSTEEQLLLWLRCGQCAGDHQGSWAWVCPTLSFFRFNSFQWANSHQYGFINFSQEPETQRGQNIFTVTQRAPGRAGFIRQVSWPGTFSPPHPSLLEQSSTKRPSSPYFPRC